MSVIDLRHGDCLELMKDIPDNSIDLILCDLPYGTTACPWDIIIPLEPLWEQYWRICSGSVLLTASQPFTSVLVTSNINNFKVEWIWKKNAGSNFATVKYLPMKEHESILVFNKKRSLYNPQMQERAPSGLSRVKTPVKSNSTAKDGVYGVMDSVGSKKSELRVPSSVQLFNRERGLHPTQKPVALMEYFIKTYSNEGDTVLDNCMGSGTTGIACINTNRNFIGIEKDDNYFNVAKNRIEGHTK